MVASEQNDTDLAILNREISRCCRCARLVDHREKVGHVQRRAYRGQEYWSKPVPGFGDSGARLLILGLAPGAHGANRTGRMFTGDRSGEFLYRALYQTGFASQPDSVSREDGLKLIDAYITAPVRCVPPDNKPAREEILTCRSFLARELRLLTKVQLTVVLGGIALGAYLSVLQDQGLVKSRAPFKFGHGATYQPYTNGPLVLACYHPSQQNTFTGRLSANMLRDLFAKARAFLDAGPNSVPTPGNRINKQ